MMRLFVQRTALVLGAGLGLLGTRPATANAQKALVYCPVGIDATGCNALVNALTGPTYPLGVDRGYDGTGGTVDLKTVDLFTYAVFVVPSLADDPSSQPYAVLRDPEVAEHLRAALIGRLAMWSGSPDQGATNRAVKDALIQNLAGWASASFGAAKGPGLVALLDASASTTSRYDWVRAITPVPVTSDPALLIYGAVRALDARATSILTSGAGPIAYDNMATFGFQVPNGAAGVSLDAVGQTGTTQGGQVVLLTMDAGNASGATVQTDKDDYPPGTPVFITGAGWQPGEAVKLTLHHDPIRDADTELTATADADGKIANSDFAPGDYDIDVRFVLTAVGQGSGRRAQTTFTDGQPQTVSLTPGSVSVVAGASAVYATDVTMGGNGTTCTVTLEVTTALPTGASASFNSNPVNATNVNFSRTLTISTTNSGPPAGRTPPGTYPFTVRATRGANCQSSGNGPTTNGTLVVTGNTNTNTALASSLNPSTYGQSVTFTATVTGTTNPQCGTVAFKDGATTINTATLSGTNVATFNTSTLTVGSHTITADYTPAASGCAFNASTSNTVSQTVNSRPITVTADAKSKVYGVADPALTYQITSGGPLVGSDVFTGSLSRAAGENVGTFAITQGTLALNANYTLTYVGANLTITARPLTITADVKTKVYGNADPAFTYVVSAGPLVGTDAVTGTLARVAGETVGAYAILQGSVTAGANYAITYIGANLSITQRPITVTANPQTKVYGDADPAFTYQLTGTLVTGDAFTGALSRPVGENVGAYALQLGTLTAGTNYATTFVPANLSINGRPIAVTADATTKVYGIADPAFTYQVTTGSLAFTDTFTGALGRAAGESVGTYAISQGTLSAGPNYNLTFNGANLTITVRPITVTADVKSKVYGDAEPALTYQITAGALAFADAFTGTLSRAAGENVGSYAITQGTLALTANYALIYNGANLTIGARPLAITADAKSKVYGDGDPALTYQLTSGTLVAGDGFTGNLTRVAGENVGPYAIQQGTVTAGTNYTITFVSASLTITQRSITVTADAKSKVYGDGDPVFTYQVTVGSLVTGDTFSGALARAAGESVGSFAITQGTLTAGANYALTYVGASLTITTRPVTVTADAKTKVFGDSDPALTYQITSGSLAFSDVFSGALTRAPGSNVGSYAILQGTLALSSNYALTFVGADLTITRRPITVTADAKSRTYGDADPALTYQVTIGTLVDEADLTGALARAPGENVGNYAITQGTLAATANYTLSFTGASLTINKRPITIAADPKTKVYGNADPAFTYQITSGTLVFTDAFAGVLTRAPGENVGTYAILQGGVTAGGNYEVAYVGADLTITQRPITVTANAQTKTYGDADPAFTYAVTIGSLAFSDAFSGTLDRDAGENVGTYAIKQGTLTAGGNYVLAFVGANLTITKRAVTITADAKTKTYGDADPALTFQVTTGSLAFADAFAGSLVRVAGETVGTYTINQGTVALSNNYTLSFAPGAFSITQRNITVTADAKNKTYGDGDPALTYQLTSGTLVSGDVIAGSLTRAAGENVGTYAIQQGTVTAGGNYNLSYVGADLTITQRAITITADAKSKVYGDADPALTYQITSGTLAFSDAFAGLLTRAAGENVETHAIQQGTVTAGTNYNLTYVAADLTITARPITITADAKSKTYGDADPGLTYQITGGALQFSDAFAGALTRASGETIGPYAIQQGTVALSTNYTLSYVGANLTIIKRLATWTTQPATKVFGTADPAPLTTGSGTNFMPADGVSATYSRAAGESVPGPYLITATLGSLASGALANYTITNVGANFTITKATPAIVWTGMPSEMDQGTALTSGQLNASAQGVSGTVAGTMTYTLQVPPATPVSAGSTVYGVGPYNVLATFTSSDPNYNGTSLTNVLTVNNQAPTVTLITLPTTAIALNSTANLTARFTDPGLTDTHTYSIDWDWDLLTGMKTPGSFTSTFTNVSTDVSVANPLGTINSSYTYPAAGVYTVRVTVNDNSGLTGARTSQNEAFAYVVVYDASGGFVTGGGWINSPANACLLTTACVGATGKANFGFVAKYKKGQTAPDGNTEFQFQAGNLNFSSTAYEWLVVAGTKAQYKGRGTINGSGNYGFMLTAVDGDTKGNPDTFRMKIWINNANGTITVVYDNQMGLADDGTPTMVLGGGSIQIHDK